MSTVELTYSETRLLEYLTGDDRRFVGLDTIVAELHPDLTTRQIISGLASLKRLRYVAGQKSFAATGLGEAVWSEIANPRC